MTGLVLNGAAFAQGMRNRDDFIRYHVPLVHSDGPSEIHISDARSRRSIQQLYYAVDTDGINFAGHYTLAEIGCGAGCIRLAAVDELTGNVTWMAQTISNWPRPILDPVRFRSDSRLIAIDGELDEKRPSEHRLVLFGEDGFAVISGDASPRR